MSRGIVQIRQFILLSVDLIILYASLFLSLLIRYQGEISYNDWTAHFMPFTIIYIFWVIVFYINGLYDISVTRNTGKFWRTFFSSLGINALLAVAIFYLNPSLGIAPKTNLFINLGVFSILFLVWRSLYNKFVTSSLVSNRVLIIGNDNEAIELIKIINKKPQMGYKIVGFARTDPNLKKPFLGPVPLYHFVDFKYIFSKKKIDTVVVPSNLNESKELIKYLYPCISFKVSFVDFISFYETLTGKIPVSAVTEYWFLQNLKEGDKKLYDTIKILFDFGLALFFGIITLTILPAIALAIKIEDKGPIFYKQKRIGKFGKIFEIIKFRTMVEDAEKDGAKFSSKGDARITKIGNFLRATRLDEFPQILNVLRGEMSFLGPRPERPEFVEKLEEAMPFYTLRHLVKPGLTGWAQISYPYAGSIEENLKKLQYDLFYIKNRSTMIDSMILLKTINILVRRKGV